MRFIFTSFALVIGLLIAGCVWGLLATDLTLNPAGFGKGAFFIAFWGGLGFMIQRFKGDRRLYNLFYVLAVLVTFSLLTYVWTYTSVALHFPLIDKQLAAFDASLGFDWVGFYNWLNDHRIANISMEVTYKSFVIQLMFLTLLLAWRGQVARMWELSWLFWVSLFVCELVSRLWLSIGAFAFYEVRLDEPYVKEFLSLYGSGGGVPVHKVLGEEPTHGLIQFPSFHAVGCIVYAYAARGIKVVFPLFVIINAYGLIALMPIGGHYLADMLGGIVIAVVMILTHRRFAKQAAIS